MIKRILLILLALLLPSAAWGQIPTFTKLGAKLTKPAWMPSSGVTTTGPYFPRVFDNDAVRSTLPGVPATSYSVLYSTDHNSGTGSIGRADFDSIEGTWTDSGAAIHSGVDQRETPYPVYDADNSRINVYVHDDSSTVTDGSQQTRLLTTNDLSALTDQGAAVTHGHHSGYAYAERLGANSWRMVHGLVGAATHNNWIFAVSDSTNGTTYSSRVALLHSSIAHLAPSGYKFSGFPSYFQYGGQRYLATDLTNATTNKGEACVAIPVASDWVTPIGGYYTLITKGTGTDPDADQIRHTSQVLDIGGTLYLIYGGVNSSNENAVCIAKQDVGTLTASTPNWAIRSDGELVRHTSESTVVDWDAANDAYPAALTTTVAAGTDASSQSAGNYYEFKLGTTNAERSAIRTTDRIDPSSYETIEIDVEGLYLNPLIAHQVAFGFQGAIGTADGGVVVFWSSGSNARRGGALFVYDGATVRISDSETKSLSWSSSESVVPWVRNNPFRITARLHDYGKRFTLYVDGSVAYHRDVEADLIGFPAGGVYPSLELRGVTTGNANWARFTNITVRTYAIAPPTSLAATPGDEQITLTWTDPAGSDLDVVHVERSTTSGSGFSRVSGSGVAIGTETFTDTSLTNGTTYYYRLVSEDGTLHESAATSEASETPEVSGGLLRTIILLSQFDRQRNQQAHFNRYGVYALSP